jgi:uncharacterized lipoprotein NlpE involved in copper resistance
MRADFSYLKYWELNMIKIASLLALVLTVTGCANKKLSKDMLNENLHDAAKPLYQSCLKDYKKTMSDNDAKKVCTEKLKASYDKISKK